MKCHVHPHVEDSWKLSKHVNNGSGVKTHCVACHLPPQSDTWGHYTAKAKLGLKDVWSYLTKDTSEMDWDLKSELEHAVKYIPNESCKDCHQNLFPEGVTDDGVTAHLYYEENEEKLDLQCISCHLDAGHYNPNYSHSKMTGIGGLATGSAPVDTSLFFKEPAIVTSFTDYVEQIPGTMVSFKMKAIPGGTFKMGSEASEPFHQADEAPVRTVSVSPFFMAEVEVTWDQYWAFYGQTMSEGRTPPETVYANNSSDPEVDAISGPTPPFGFPDQGWGSGERPAIVLLHGDAQNAASPYNAITTTQLEQCGADYVALGHIHAPSGLLHAGKTAYAWPGCAMGRGFDETGPRGVYVGTLTEEGCDLQFHPLDSRRYLILTVEAGADPRQSIVDALPPETENDIYRIVLTGPSPRLDVISLEESLAPRFFGLTIVDETYAPRDLWEARGQDTLRGLFLQALYERRAEDRELYEMAAQLGVAALDGREVPEL